MRRMEHLNRGLVALSTEEGIFLSWRFLGDEEDDIVFSIYRDGEKIASVSDSTNYLDKDGTKASLYNVAPVIGGAELEKCKDTHVFSNRYLSIPLDKPDGGISGFGEFENEFTYRPGDCACGDLDGDGEYEILVMWSPTNAKDNAYNGFTGDVLIDAYKLDGTKLWRINLGKNIRAGAHYTQLMVYDFNCDGKAEVICKTADGTVDGAGTVIGDPNADYRSSSKNTYGKILDGPEFLTAFDGMTGKILDTVSYEPCRDGDWGDDEGNRVDRFLACVAYLDGERPSAVMCRGYYTRTTLTAYNLIGNKLEKVWSFDSSENGQSAYEDRGNHQLSVGDVDGDGKDEIIYGACAFDHDGTPMYIVGGQFEGDEKPYVTCTHGDTLHLGNLIPSRKGRFEVFTINEASHNKYGNAIPGFNVHDAATGEVLWFDFSGIDTGRGLAAKLVPGLDGCQYWVSGKLYDSKGNIITDMPADMDYIETITDQVLADGTVPEEFAKQNTHGRYPNFAAYWDGDLLQELVDKTWIDKWDYQKNELVNLLNASECTFINYTKSNPCLQADLFGDWREELVWPTKDGTELHIYTTTDVTDYKIRTLMHDPQYRLSVAWQNTAYNQPPHPSFYLDEAAPLPEKRNDIDVSKK
jgi:hypothetical protein